MIKRLIACTAVFLTCACVWSAEQQKQAAMSPEDIAVSSALSVLEYGEVEGPGVRFYCRVSGTSTAEGLVDIFAPFDGRVSDISTTLFSWVDQNQLLGVLASVELSAMLDATSDKNKSTTRNRWKEMYDFFQLRSPISGIVVGMYAKNKQDVFEQEKIFTIAKSIYIIAKTNEKVFVQLKPGMLAQLKDNASGITVGAVLRNFIEIGKTGQYQLRMEVTGDISKMRPGMVFDGDLMLTDNPRSAMVPVDAVIRKDGRTFLLSLIEVETGARNEWYTEVFNVFPGEVYIEPYSLLNITNQPGVGHPSRAAQAAQQQPGGVHKPNITGTRPKTKLDRTRAVKSSGGNIQKPARPATKKKTSPKKTAKTTAAPQDEPLAGDAFGITGGAQSPAQEPLLNSQSKQPAESKAPAAAPAAQQTQAAMEPAAAGGEEAVKPVAVAAAPKKTPTKARAKKKPAPVKQAAKPVQPAAPAATQQEEAQPAAPTGKLGPMQAPIYGDVGGGGGSSAGDGGGDAGENTGGEETGTGDGGGE